MADDWGTPRDREPASWWVRRWAAPITMAVAVAASIGAAQVLADGNAPSAAPHGDSRTPRFLLTVGGSGDPSPDRKPAPWFQVQALGQDGRPRLTDTVRPPSSAGEARVILAGPKGTFLVASTRERPCESRLYRFRLDDDGQVTGIAPLVKGAVPARAAGLAMSADGDRIAYTTAPCGDDPQPRANVTVLDAGSGRRTTWSTSGPSVIGEIVWARDNRTLGYVISDVHEGAPPAPPGAGTGDLEGPFGRDIGNVTVHALDTGAEGTDLRDGRVLFRQPDGSGTVTSAVMNPDARTGQGVMSEGRPASTVLFTFAEGEPIHITKVYPPEPNTVRLFSFADAEGPRYACFAGIDSFGRVSEGHFRENSQGMGGCGSATGY